MGKKPSHSKKSLADQTSLDNPFMARIGSRFSSSEKMYKRSQSIFSEGEDPKGVYYLRSGQVKLENFGPDGQGHILRIYEEGDLMGYRSWIVREPYRSSAIAHEDCVAGWISGDDFAQLLKESPELSTFVMTLLSRELASTEDRLCALTDKGIRARIAEAVLYFDAHSHHRYWTRREIAEWAGTTPESVMRVLSAFQDEGLIASEERKTKILRIDALRKLAKGL